MEHPPEMLVMMVKDSFQTMLDIYQEKRNSLQYEFDGILIERHRHLLDELERDIKIGLARIRKHEQTDDWSQETCENLLRELRLHNQICGQKVRRLAKIFPSCP